MDALIFQWDKACDAMPVLKPLSKVAGLCFILGLMLVVFPGMFSVDNEGRGNPTVLTEFDPVAGEYVNASAENVRRDALHNVETNTLVDAVRSENITAPLVQGNIVSQAAPPGIGATARKSLDGDEWDHKVEVGYIVSSGFGRQKLKDNTGVWVDTRDLHEVSRHLQKLTLEPPRKGHMPVLDTQVEVQTLRSVVTNCRYYALEVFGERRLILGGSGELGSSGC